MKSVIYKSRGFKICCVLMIATFVNLGMSDETSASQNLNLDKKIDFDYEEISYGRDYVVNRDLDSQEENVIQLGKLGYEIYVEGTEERVGVTNPISEIVEIGPISSFNGLLTGYGPDCVGCGGKVACSPNQDVRNGNIYYEDEIYGTLRIVAADKKVSCGSIVVISNFYLSEEPIIAIVLDRGGAIKGNKMDLLYEKEADTVIVGKQRNIEFDILREGW